MKALSYYFFFLLAAALLSGVGGCSKSDQCGFGMRHDCAQPDNTTFNGNPTKTDGKAGDAGKKEGVITEPTEEEFKPTLNVQLTQEVDRHIYLDCKKVDGKRSEKQRNDEPIRTSTEKVRFNPMKPGILIDRALFINTRNDWKTDQRIRKSDENSDAMKYVNIGATGKVGESNDGHMPEGLLLLAPNEETKVSYVYESCVTPEESAPNGCATWKIEEKADVRVNVRLKVEVKSTCYHEPRACVFGPKKWKKECMKVDPVTGLPQTGSENENENESETENK